MLTHIFFIRVLSCSSLSFIYLTCHNKFFVDSSGFGVTSPLGRNVLVYPAAAPPACLPPLLTCEEVIAAAAAAVAKVDVNG